MVIQEVLKTQFTIQGSLKTFVVIQGVFTTGGVPSVARTPSVYSTGTSWSPRAAQWRLTGGGNTCTNFGHVDPHWRVESACAGSYGQVFSSNPCGLTFRGNEDEHFYGTRSVST